MDFLGLGVFEVAAQPLPDDDDRGRVFVLGGGGGHNAVVVDGEPAGVEPVADLLDGGGGGVHGDEQVEGGADAKHLGNDAVQLHGPRSGLGVGLCPVVLLCRPGTGVGS